MHIWQRIRDRIACRRERWEALCKKCGLCCFEKDTSVFKAAIRLSLPCEYLERETGLCSIYEKRFELCLYCSKVTLWHALFSPCLPEACGYVEKYRKWRFIKPAQIKP